MSNVVRGIPATGGIFSQPLRFLRTIRYLRPRQIGALAARRLDSGWTRRRLTAHVAIPPFQGCRWPEGMSLTPPGPQNNSEQASLAGRFVFLNELRTVGWPPEWDPAGASRLWSYNLHYFEWLWALDYPHARAAVLDWIENCPPARAGDAWDPYPASLRITNWCGFFWGVFRDRTLADREFADQLWQSICVQAEWLCKRIEIHLLGNHLVENAVALAFAGSCFEGHMADRWRKIGMAILTHEIPEQILADGMHFERSPMYHVRIMYALGLLRDTGCSDLLELVGAPLSRMRRALSCLCHPDGEISLFNDSAFHIGNAPRDLLRGPPQFSQGPWALPEAGYYGFRDNDRSYVICDAGAIGPDYNPGHAHGDIFSFELFLAGHRVVVDSGVHDYVPGEMRRYCRSTRAHNTVEVAGEDQCEFWGAFRVARRGRPHDIEWEPSVDGFRLRGWHDGYRRLAGSPIHRRTLIWHRKGVLEVHDQVETRKPVQAVVRIHLHPECTIQSMNFNQAKIGFPGGRFEIVFSGSGKLEPEKSYYCPEFGKAIPNVALAFTFESSKDDTVSFTLKSD